MSQISEVGRKTDKAFALAVLDFKAIRDYDEDDVLSVLGVLFTQMAVTEGTKDIITDYDKQDIAEMILTRFKSLSVEEIGKAFKLNRYAPKEAKIDSYGLFNATFVAQVLHNYKKWLQNVRLVNNLPMRKITPEPELSDTLKRETINAGILRTFKEVQAGGDIGYGCAWIYDHLADHIKASNQKKKKVYIMAQAKAKLELDRNNPHYKTIVHRIATKRSSDVIVIAKKMLLVEYLSELTEVELLKILNDE